MRRTCVLRWGAAFAALLALISFAWLTLAHAAPAFPALTGRVVDNASILSADTRARLTGILARLEQKTGDQVVVATLKSLQGYAIEDYGYQLGRAWGIGQKGKNNGAILVVAPNERRVRIEVGYGLEGTLTDAASKLIIEDVVIPQFRAGNYDAGVQAGTIELVRLLGGDKVDLSKVPEPPQPAHEDRGGGIPWVVIALVLIWIVFGRFFWPLLFLPRRGWGSGWGGGFGGGGFSSGGGSFGGGGASGSW